MKAFKEIQLVGALIFLAIAAWLGYLLASPSPNCEVGIQCSSNGWNSTQTIVLIIIVLLIGLSGYMFTKILKNDLSEFHRSRNKNDGGPPQP